MDLLPIVKAGIEALPEGPHSPGLRAVVNHIEMAIRHLQSGQSSGEVQLYTDAIYRCNQAFEGSIKELYRVVASKDPSKTTPDKIEKFLEEGNLLRAKVINQLTRYRQEWRNPSTHDYTMDFDENEAFLAIVNIAAFAKMAVGQIASKLAFDEASKSDTDPPSVDDGKGKSQPLPVRKHVAIYTKAFFEKKLAATAQSEVQVNAMVAGFISKIKGMSVAQDSQLAQDHRYRVDIVAEKAGTRCAIELKSLKSFQSAPTRAFEQLRTYLQVGMFDEGVLVIYDLVASEYRRGSVRLHDNKVIDLVLPVEVKELEKLLPKDAIIIEIGLRT